MKPGWAGVGRGRMGRLASVPPSPSECRLGAETAFRALETSDRGFSRLLLPWAPEFIGEGRGSHEGTSLLDKSRSSLPVPG